MPGVKRSLGAMMGQNNNHGDDVHNRGREPSLVAGSSSSRPRSANNVENVDPRTRTPSPTFPPLTGEIPDFQYNATLVLVGIRGAGKTTLAIMASSAMKRKVVDMETAFQRATGLSSASYKQQQGTSQCHRQQAKILQGILDRNRNDCIIVCSWMESRVQALLREFASTNPVVHVLRDLDAIQGHLKIRDCDKMLNLLNVSRAIFRTCTNFEFFNVTENPVSIPSSPSSDSLLDRQPAPFLTLKQAERHLLKFLSLIYPNGAIPFIESVFPLTTVPLDELPFTYALTIKIGELLQRGFDIEEHVAGADVVQLVVDTLSASMAAPDPSGFLRMAPLVTKAVGILRRATVLPIMIHIVLPHVLSDDQIENYLDHVEHAVRLAPEIITISLELDEEDISRIMATKGRSRIIGDYQKTTPSSVTWDKPTWISLYKKASDSGCDMVRLVRMADSLEDNLAVNRLRLAIDSMDCRRIPLIAYNSGALGRHSACFNPILTAVSTSSGTKSHRLQSESWLTAPEAMGALCSSFMFDPMKLYVFGVKVGYSLSPAMHNAGIAACNLPHRYEPHSTNSLSSIQHLISDPNFGGASIGLPFKVEIISLTHSLSHHARAIGAVNTLIPIRSLNEDRSIPQGAEFFRSVGRAGMIVALYGENTDWIGIRACIRRGLSPANAVRPGTCGLIIGAGGMARAAVYAILQVGVQNIVIWNRTTANAEKMADHFTQLLTKSNFQSLGAGSETKFHILKSCNDPWPKSFNLPTIIISCIPTHAIGNVPAPDFTVPGTWLGSRTGGVVIELGYKTLDTPLLAQARREAARGWVTMDGLDLLPEQGFAQFELFTGRRAPRRAMRRDLMKAYTDEQGREAGELKSREQNEE